MSRCFPYPPPGFEKKDRSDRLDLSVKQKEKKHKKEKRDKEKKESKEKKEGKEKKHKDRSKHKHEDKKDRKERHKDKKRDKDKNRSFDDGKRIGGQTGCQEKAGVSIPKVEEVKDYTFTQELGGRVKDEKGEAKRMLEKLGSNSEAEEVDAFRFPKELGRRMEIEKKAAANRMLENFSSSIPKRVEGLDISSAPEKERGNRNPVVANFVRKEETKANGVAQRDRVNHDHQIFSNGNAVRVNHDHQAFPNGNAVAANFVIKEQRRADGIGQSAEKGSHNNQLFSHRNPVASNFISTEQRRVYRIPKAGEKGNHNQKTLLQTPLEKCEVKSIEPKEKGKYQEADNKHDDKQRDRERKKKNKENGKYRENEKEMEEKQQKKRENGENNHKEQDRPNDRVKKDQTDNLNFNPVAAQTNNGKFTGSNGHTKKRKEFEMNGFLHVSEDEVSPNKLLRPASSSHHQSGRILEPEHIHTVHPSMRHVIPNNIKAEIMMNDKALLINDTTVARESPADLRHSVAADTSGKSKIISKPPHPDSKFLGQIYSIPRLEVLPEFDDQEWLFGSGNHQPKPKKELEANELPQVWAEGMKIEMADVFALPYVIPY